MKDVIHRRQFMGGRKSVEQVHSDLAFPPGAKCGGCGKRPYVRGITMAPLKEVLTRSEAFAQTAMCLPEEVMANVVQLRGSDGKPEPFLRLGVQLACKSCAPAMERALAKMPSWVLVEINRGPAPERVITSGRA